MPALTHSGFGDKTTEADLFSSENILEFSNEVCSEDVSEEAIDATGGSVILVVHEGPYDFGRHLVGVTDSALSTMTVSRSSPPETGHRLYVTAQRPAPSGRQSPCLGAT